MNGAEDPAMSQMRSGGRRAVARKHRGWHRAGRLGATLAVLLVAGFGVLAVLASTGKAIRLPVWMVAEIEARLNRTIAMGAEPAAALALSLGGVELVVPADWVPRFQLDDVRLRRAAGPTLVSLPEARITLDPVHLARGQLRVRTIALVGAQLSIRRDADGAFDLVAGAGEAAIADAQSFAALLDAGDAAFLSPALAALVRVEVQGLSLTVTDARADRRWELGDGRLVLERRADALAGELSVTLIDGGKAPAMATIGITSALGDSAASLTATVTGMAAHDVAAMAAPLAFLSVLNAPISGRIAGRLDGQGRLAALEGELELGGGSLRPQGGVAPLPFEKAGLALSYDPATADVVLQRLFVQSRSVRLEASGHAYLRDREGKAVAAGAVPEVILGQMRFSDVLIDPEGQFAAPVRFSDGALDMRLTLQPFRVEIGQLALTEGAGHLLLSGAFGIEDSGWTSRIDIALDHIRHERLLKLWPLQLVPRTRAWLAENVHSGDLFNVNAALRSIPGQEPAFSLGYEFAGTDIRFMRSLPPIRDGHGRASIEGERYVLALDRGHVIAPKGGKVVLDGSVFEVADISLRPTRADITVVSSASLTATLSILDQPPFHFLTKAGRPVDIGEGRADLVTRLSLPLLRKVGLADVSYAATGMLHGLSSSAIMPGRTVAARELAVEVTSRGLALTGAGTLDGAGFDVSFLQGFGPEAGGRSQVRGSIAISADMLRAFGVELPAGMIDGIARGAVTLDLEKDAPGRLRISSDLQGLAISLPALGWRKDAAVPGDLAVDVLLGPKPEITEFVLDAPGLGARGDISLRPGGGLERMRLDRITVGDWLDGEAEITGQGADRAPLIALTGGRLDLRLMPKLPPAAADAPPLSLRLDAVVVAEGITLSDLRGEVANRGGLTGDFVAGVNGIGRVQGAIAPQPQGSAIRIRSRNAGQVLAAAGIFASGRGGALDLVLRAQEDPGEFAGTAAISSIRVVDAPVLAELLNAVSVIGVLEQLNGEGLLFSSVDLDFRMAAGKVEIARGAAIGASMGVSFAGLYDAGTRALDLQGVVSPFYLLNGIGAILSRRGEGLFGFNYRLHGLASDPQVAVNPLSILTPGMFRDILRASPPTLRNPQG